VGIKKTGEHIRVNFGQSPFIYKIDKVIEVRERMDFLPTNIGNLTFLMISQNVRDSSFKRLTCGLGGTRHDQARHLEDKVCSLPGSHGAKLTIAVLKGSCRLP
jgi:hypothetical protein